MMSVMKDTLKKLQLRKKYLSHTLLRRGSLFNAEHAAEKQLHVRPSAKLFSVHVVFAYTVGESLGRRAPETQEI